MDRRRYLIVKAWIDTAERVLVYYTNSNRAVRFGYFVFRLSEKELNRLHSTSLTKHFN